MRKNNKILQIKFIIENNKMNLAFLKAAKTDDEKRYWSSKVKMSNELINEIYKIVKDE